LFFQNVVLIQIKLNGFHLIDQMLKFPMLMILYIVFEYEVVLKEEHLDDFVFLMTNIYKQQKQNELSFEFET